MAETIEKLVDSDVEEAWFGEEEGAMFEFAEGHGLSATFG